MNGTLVMARRVPVLVAAAMLTLVIGIEGSAQTGDNIEDVLVAERTIQSALGSPEGEAVWLNERTRHRGTVRVIREGRNAAGTRCREYEHLWYLDKVYSRYTGVRCLDERGLWKLVEPEKAEGPFPLHTAQATPPAPEKRRPAEPPPDTRLAPTATVDSGAVRRLQANLVRLRYLAGAPDGRLDGTTDGAVRRYAEDHGLNVADLTAEAVRVLLEHSDGRVLAHRGAQVCPLPATLDGQFIIGCGTVR